MRWPRAGIVVGMIGLVLGAGWWLAAAGSAGPTPKRSAHAIGLRPPQALLQALQQYLAPRGRPGSTPLTPRALVPRALASPNGSTCPVAAGGFCSLRPCVVLTGRATAAVITTGPRAVVQQSVSPGTATCQGHSAPPRTVPVAGS